MSKFRVPKPVDTNSLTELDSEQLIKLALDYVGNAYQTIPTSISGHEFKETENCLRWMEWAMKTLEEVLK